ncbi:MAG: adaptor protein MecA [Caldibacillus debilis]|jgi:adapter protein MecA 1/2|uniref:Adapter protein MecA n=2 Tax=Caldibacillus debilis TaxID=301148 RepID=A0A420VCZ6_9BACI|nr:adaptor protein MecA [Caldibacillus debilis]MBO2481057.1 adaptor protein MecA [Bacillaceae bacterium]KYD10635.1 hypothetical protein B4135_3436 [Caldibacillus debilis]MBY6272217.1 adaptor protein MecA [Bacillaceae bacterium]OUM84231.1 MAG: adaptor protein MecA [Caldibacillus debilis]REJ15049.1 MAG: adaptor protein MecA [Caldibacillus debilis]
MEIERINENTVKLFISYVDVEERGFDREEIWYNREKGEELFWEMMDEIHQEEDFAFDGPLWIQVHALDKGLEVVVTKAQIAKDGQRFEVSFGDDKENDGEINERIEELLDQQFLFKEVEPEEDYDGEGFSFVAYFDDFEDLIALAKYPWEEVCCSKLFALEGKYYLYLEFAEDSFETEKLLGRVLEYGRESNRTVHYLMEYGKEIISEDVFAVLKKHFN